ncbi:MAG: hypothetical protein HQK54_12905, partial [Oligoflexales bacterium]|nr:hypothetical protein [Oligoflexales bacterium]
MKYIKKLFTCLAVTAVNIFFAGIIIAGQEPEAQIILEKYEYYSHNITRQISFLEDREGIVNLPDILAGKFDRDFFFIDQKSPSLTLKKEGINVWGKVNFSNPGTKKIPLILEHHSALTNHVILYSPDGSGNYRETASAGDRIAFSKREIKYRYPAMKLEIPEGKSTFFIKMNQSVPYSLSFALWTPQRFHENAMSDYVSLGLLYGFLLVMMGYNAFLYLSFKSWDYLFFVLYIFFFL